MAKWKPVLEMVQDRVRPAILFGFFWVAIRRRKSLTGCSARRG
jgi:hypothetical protein